MVPCRYYIVIEIKTGRNGQFLTGPAKHSTLSSSPCDEKDLGAVLGQMVFRKQFKVSFVPVLFSGRKSVLQEDFNAVLIRIMQYFDWFRDQEVASSNLVTPI